MNMQTAQTDDNPTRLTSPAMHGTIYEQPLNERIRTLLKLEALFQRYFHCRQGDHYWDAHNCVDALIDILTICSRSDLKSELIKELERLTTNLSRLCDRQDVDQPKLQELLDDMQRAEDGLKAIQGQLASHLRDNEFINAAKQRINIPGGTCSFDLPAYHLWLHQGLESRQQALDNWGQEFELLKTTVDLILGLTREAGIVTEEYAENGFFQKSLDNNDAYQLIRIALPQDSLMFPEISAGKQRVTVYFRELDLEGRPSQTGNNFSFALSTCMI